MANTAGSPRVILSPMAGYTDVPFRIVCRELGSDWGMTELISADGIVATFPKIERWAERVGKPLDEVAELLSPMYARENKVAGLPLYATARIEKTERPVSIQVFGNNPEVIANSAKILIQMFHPDGIDINMGCPARDVFRHGSGCALLATPKKVVEIVKAVRQIVNDVAPEIPLSVKTRLGIENENELEPLVEPMFNAGLDMLIVHARIYRDFFSGAPRLAALQKVVDRVRKVKGYVIGNGGVVDLESAKQMMETGVDGLAVGRGAVGNPWIFKTIKENKQYKPTLAEITRTVQRHATLAWKHSGKQGILEMRKHLGAYFKGIKNAKKHRMKLVTVKSLADIKNVLKSIKYEKT